MRGIQITAVSLLGFAVLVTAVRFVWNSTRARGHLGISQEHRAQEQPHGARQQAPGPIAPFAMTVNLASFSPTRGEEAKNSANKIHLPPKLLRVSFLLPVGTEPGEYALRLEDSAGTALKDIRAVGRLNDGITSVEVDLDLTAASRGNFTLTIWPPGLSSRTFPVSIE
jgi:hypothetical protein